MYTILMITNLGKNLFNEKNIKKLFYYIIVTVFYAVIYFLLSRNKEIEHFNGLNSKSNFIDCLYFSFTTFSTVGYGDISPKSTLAKIIVVSHQIVMMMKLIDYFDFDKNVTINKTS